MTQKTDKRNYCVFAVFMIPVSSVEAGEAVLISDVPAGAPMVSEIVEQADLYTDDDWEMFGLNVMTAFARRCRRQGWPTVPDEPKAPEGPQQGVHASETPDAGPNVVPKPLDGTCWACGAIPVELARGIVCPNGCAEWDDVFGANAGKSIAARELDNEMREEQSPEQSTGLPTGGGGLESYAETTESRKPTSFPQGDALPTTD